MIEKKKILFVLPSLGIGGAERVITNLCNHLDRAKYEIQIVLLKESRKSYFSLLNRDVSVIQLKLRSRLRYSLIHLLWCVKKQKADVVFMGIGDLNLLVSPFLFLFRGSRWIARETNTVSLRVKNPFIHLLYKIFYRNFDCVVAQSNGMKTDLIQNFALPENRVVVIENPIDVDYISEKLIQGLEEAVLPKIKINLVACGRLTVQKGFDNLIKAFSKVRNIQDYHLTIIGESMAGDFEDQSTYLIQLVKDLQLEEFVSFAGHQSNIYPILEKADFFVLSSRYEGFANVVLESLACGTPVLANLYSEDIFSIIEDRVNGLVFSIEQESFDAILEEALKINWSKVEIMESIRRFHVQSVVKKYEQIL